MCSSSTDTFTRWGQVMLLFIGCDVMLVVTNISLDTHMLTQPNSWQYVGEPLVLLVVYAVIAWCLSWHPSRLRLQVIAIGAGFGIATGLLWVINLSIETFVDNAGIPLTAPFLLSGFLLWGVAGFVAAKKTLSFALGLAAAIWSAMICVVITITFGLLLPFFAMTRLQDLLRADPDFARSGWSSLRDFVLANQFDSAFSHLLGALVLSALFGAIGSGVGLLAHGRKLLTV